ncbi:hypothetical protein [Sphingobium sp. MI1205]|uniref:hypothetical protein n=1 Tax=Sphingobium sp. MI1205 TaxID=407020 RepID=UPI0011A6F538|nr:hypothetical protein [Sphingobium sp. MI1205]
MILMIMLAVVTATKKGNPFTDFFTAFGAVGQVVFAYMVWKLSREQFAFTRRVTERQLRVDIYHMRKKLLDEFLNMYEVTDRQSDNRADIDDDLVTEWYSLSDEISRVFSQNASKPLAEMVDLICLAQPDTEYMKDMGQRHKGDLKAATQMMKDHWNKISQLRFQAWHAMHQELSLSDHLAI